jgi:hypothetical protein
MKIIKESIKSAWLLTDTSVLIREARPSSSIATGSKKKRIGKNFRAYGYTECTGIGRTIESLADHRVNAAR